MTTVVYHSADFDGAFMARFRGSLNLTRMWFEPVELRFVVL